MIKKKKSPQEAEEKKEMIEDDRPTGNSNKAGRAF